MIKVCHQKNQTIFFIKGALLFCWCAFLTETDSYYISYLFTGLVGSVCFTSNHIRKIHEKEMSKRDSMVTDFYVCLLAMAVLLSNYKKFIQFTENKFLNLTKIISAIIVFLGGTIVFKEILLFIYWKMQSLSKQAENINRPKTKWVFLFTWGILVAQNSFILLETQYPGILTPDSISQIRQTFTSTYTNHHPYYHTQIIHLFVSVGYHIFGNMNAAVATYSIFSVCMMAFCFAYVVCTVYQLTGNRWLSFTIFLWYCIMPFHIMYSFTMWKDVFWSAMVTLFAVSSFRILKHIGSSNIVDYCVILCAAIGVCLLRSNGLAVYVFSILIFMILFGRNHKKMFVLLVSAFIVSVILKYPILNVLKVPQPDTIEALSIPVQQIARVITDGKILTNSQENLLSEVIDISKIPETYDSIISDPIKTLVRDKNNQEFIRCHKSDFIKLYIQLGFRYPHKYVEAWVDQTKGYWNAGYPYWRWSTGVYENPFGIQHIVRSNSIQNLFMKYLKMWENSSILQLFLSIGFHVWLIIISTYVAVVERNRFNLFVSVPFLMVILSLLIATPVYAEFRYSYAAFCGIPFVLATCFEVPKYSSEEKEEMWKSAILKKDSGEA